jgi:hypothetical protein
VRSSSLTLHVLTKLTAQSYSVNSPTVTDVSPWSRHLKLLLLMPVYRSVKAKHNIPAKTALTPSLPLRRSQRHSPKFKPFVETPSPPSVRTSNWLPFCSLSYRIDRVCHSQNYCLTAQPRPVVAARPPPSLTHFIVLSRFGL